MHWLCLLVIAGLAALPAWGADPLPPAAGARGEVWEADGPVNTLLATNGIVYVGGSFTHLSPPGHRAAPFDLFTGETAAGFPSIQGAEVLSALADGSGGWFLGGRFVSVGGRAVTNLVHLRADHTPDPDFNPAPDGAVRALARSGSWLFLGGDFTSVGGTPARGIARCDVRTGTVTPWGPGVNSGVNALVVAGDGVYAGGSFTRAGAVARTGVAAFDAASGAVIESWTPPTINGEVLALTLLDDRLLVAGSFPSVGGVGRNGLAALDLGTAGLLPWAPGPGAQSKVLAMQVHCDALFVGGSFLTMGGVVRHGVALVDLESGATLDWDAALQRSDTTDLLPQVNAILLTGERLLLGGDFTLGPGNAHQNLAAVDVESAKPLPWSPTASATVQCLAMDGRALVAGFDRAPGGVTRHNLAALDERTGKPFDWSPALDGEVRALALAGDRLFVGGAFHIVAGPGITNLAAISTLTGGVVEGWNATADGTVNALAIVDDLLVAGGTFHTLAGAPRARLGAVSLADGKIASGWRCDAGNTVRALFAVDGQVYVGGLFPNLGGQTRPRLAAVDGKTGAVLPWTPAPPPSLSGVQSLAGVEGWVFAGQAGPPYLGVYAPAGAPLPAGLPSFDGAVNALLWSGDRLYVGGAFRIAGEQPRAGLAALDVSGAVLEWSTPGEAPDEVLALAATPQSLAAGGRANPSVGDRSTLRNEALFSRVGAPVWVHAPSDMQAAVHAPVRVSVEVQGSSPLTYEWLHEGVPIPDATGPELTLASVSAADAGNYRVVVTNPVGTIAADFFLQVLAAPVIQSGPASATLASGTSVKLTVLATASPSPVYQWRLNGVNIPGAVDAVLPLDNVTPQSGGSYSVVVANAAGSALTEPAAIQVPIPLLPFSDLFAARSVLTEASGTGEGSNVGATREATEPRHAARPGGASVWIAWKAPFSGVATFSTRGSSFDTLIAVYTNQTLAGLREVASDDDSGGFATSRADVNVVEGTEYEIAIDGVGGATGRIVLSWNATPGPADLPSLDIVPARPTVAEGQAITLVAGPVPEVNTQVQWFHDCRRIAGATNLTLHLQGVGASSVGAYSALFRTTGGRVISSRPSLLEVGPVTTVHTFDKPEEAFDLLFGPLPPPAPAPADVEAGSGPLLLSVGASISHLFSTASGTPAMPARDQCTLYTGSPTLLLYTQAVDGVVLLDTLGSDFDTLLTLYRAVPLQQAATNRPLTCDDNGAGDGQRSLLTYTGHAGLGYVAVVEAVGGQTGRVRINLQLGSAPAISVSNQVRAGYLGSRLLLESGIAAGSPPPQYRWFRNGTPMNGGTNATLTLVDVSTALAGTYSVIASNFAGVVTNLAAVVTVGAPLTLSVEGDPARLRLRLLGDGGMSYRVYAAASLAPGSGSPEGWELRRNGRLPADGQLVLDEGPAPASSRFYRVVMDPP